MSKRKILAALKKKNIPVERVEYMRAEPTPSITLTGGILK